MGGRVIDELLPQVRLNCLISDAGYWGYYSTCGLLLRLREQYRFEEEIPPGASVDIRKVGPWIEKREAEWQRLENEPLRDIHMGEGRVYDPFDSAAINLLIEPEGFVYGGGHGVYMKPVFFLAELKGKSSLGPYTVQKAGRELIRDLSIHPAMSRDSLIIARSDMTRAMIQDRFDEYRASGRQGMLAAAFKVYGIGPEASQDDIREVADSELDTFLHHEYGEIRESERLGPDWSGLLESLGTSRTGLELRGVKDTLADTTEGGTLEHIIEGQKAGSLYFYVGSLTGIRYTLTSAVRDAVRDIASEPVDWGLIEKARMSSYKISMSVVNNCLEAYLSSRPEDLEENVKAALLRTCPIKR
jgi:hypothetical protein